MDFDFTCTFGIIGLLIALIVLSECGALGNKGDSTTDAPPPKKVGK